MSTRLTGTACWLADSYSSDLQWCLDVHVKAVCCEHPILHQTCRGSLHVTLNKRIRSSKMSTSTCTIWKKLSPAAKSITLFFHKNFGQSWCSPSLQSATFFRCLYTTCVLQIDRNDNVFFIVFVIHILQDHTYDSMQIVSIHFSVSWWS